MSSRAISSRSGRDASQTLTHLIQTAARMSDVIRLGAGDPDLATPQEIIHEATQKLRWREGSVSSRGLDALRRAIAESFLKEKNLRYDPDMEILVTNGAQEGLFLTMLALVSPGDGVLVQDPRYPSYDQAIEAAGGRIIAVPTGRDRDFTLRPEDLQSRLKGAGVLVFVNPNNPTGSLVSPDAVQEIAEVARKSALTVISDEVYEKLAFDDAEVLSIAQCHAMQRRTIVLSSFSKTYAMSGFRVGYLAGPSNFIDAVARLKSVISGPSLLYSQYAALAALTGSQESREKILDTFTRRRRVTMEGLDSLGIPYGHPGAGFFIWADISRFGMPSDEFCSRLLKQARVLLFPGTSFGSRWHDYVRISILQPEERLAEAIDRIGRFDAALQGHIERERNES